MIQLSEAKSPRTPPTRRTMSIVNDIFWAQLPLMAVVAAALVIVGILGKYHFNTLVLTAAVSALYALVPFAAHSYVLNGESVAGFKALRAASRKAILIFIIFGLMLLLTYSFAAPYILQLIILEMGGSPSFGIFALTLLGYVLFLISFFSLFGTMFPAIVDGGKLSPIAAVKRGTIWAIFWRLSVLAVVWALLMYLLLRYFLPVFGGLIFQGGLGFLYFSNFLATMLMFFGSTILAVIFSKAYLGSYTKT